jgi:hypothetical protein
LKGDPVRIEGALEVGGGLSSWVDEREGSTPATSDATKRGCLFGVEFKNSSPRNQILSATLQMGRGSTDGTKSPRRWDSPGFRWPSDRAGSRRIQPGPEEFFL